jgi:uncharacterized protein (TIGR02646 family)
VIEIRKPKTAPKKLRTAGQKKKEAHCDSYKRNKKAYAKGDKKFDFDSDIYGHKTVKQTLMKAQHDKCCFCESKVTHVAYGDVAHFRPKAAVRQKSKGPLRRPGYYWLAYEWSNLFFSCQLCNQRYKENLFPLGDPSKRARSHGDSTYAEEPLFINPAEEPEKYLTFREEVIRPIDGNRRGRVTIKALGLDRDELNDRRKTHFDRLQIIYEVANLDPSTPLSKRAKAHIARAMKDSSEYASMVRCAVRAQFRKYGA